MPGGIVAIRYRITLDPEQSATINMVSGDLPIVLLQIEYPANIDLVRQLVQAYAYWRLKGPAVDLVIHNDRLPCG